LFLPNAEPAGELGQRQETQQEDWLASPEGLVGSQEQQERQEARQDLGDQIITGQALEVLEAEHPQQPHLTAETAGITLLLD
jgi:hypothetical protein